jgi:hypothetical protein
MTALEKRRTTIVFGASVITLAVIAFEFVAHAFMH